MRGVYDRLDTYLPGLQRKVLLPGVGHAPAEEGIDQVYELLLEFLEQLDR
jgi:pimeloyl-ACP methyl ester carboxylesterase